MHGTGVENNELHLEDLLVLAHYLVQVARLDLEHPLVTEKFARKTQGKDVIVIPEDPNALIEMLSVRLASFKAGNTGVRNEIVSICDKLLRQRQLNKTKYKQNYVTNKKDANNSK